VLDSAVLIMPLVFFISPADERLISTIKQILKPLEKGGLTSNGLVFRCMLLINLLFNFQIIISVRRMVSVAERVPSQCARFGSWKPSREPGNTINR